MRCKTFVAYLKPINYVLKGLVSYLAECLDLRDVVWQGSWKYTTTDGDESCLPFRKFLLKIHSTDFAET